MSIYTFAGFQIIPQKQNIDGEILTEFWLHWHKKKVFQSMNLRECFAKINELLKD